MLRTASSRTRSRLALPAAIATALALTVPLGGIAYADHIGSLTMTPDADSAAVGTCNPFTVTVLAPGGGPVANEIIDVTLTENPASGTQDVTFCTTPNDANPPVTPVAPNAPASSFLNGKRAEFTTGADGKFTFGVAAVEPGTIAVVAFSDTDGDNNDDDTFRDSSTKTFTAGGTQAARTLSINPASDTNVVTEQHVMVVTVRNASGDPVPGVAVTGDVVAGPNNATPVTCANPTNQQGQVPCSYVGNAPGTDQISFWVNQVNADNNATTVDTAGPNTGEPFGQASKTWNGAPSNLILDLTCGNFANDPDVCQNPLTFRTEVFNVVVTAPDSPDANDTRDPAFGVIVRFAVSDPGPNTTANPDATLNSTSCTTDSAGRCSMTLTKTNPSAAGNGTITVTATVAGQNAGNDAGGVQTTSDSATKTFRQSTRFEARNVDLRNPGFRTFTAVVVDRYGNPVQDVEVTFSTTGAGRFANGLSSITTITNAAGEAGAQLTSGDFSGTDPMTATITGFANPTAPRGAGASDDECEQAAGQSLFFAGSGPSVIAGNCADSNPANNPAITTGGTGNTGTGGGGTGGGGTGGGGGGGGSTASAIPLPSSGVSSPTPSAAPTSAAPTPSTAPTPGATQPPAGGCAALISLSTNLAQITAGNAPMLFGTATTAAGQPCSGAGIVILKKSYGETSYTPLATVTTNASGAFSLVVRPLTQTAYGANTPDGAVRSLVGVIRVNTRVNIDTPRAPGAGETSRAVVNPVTFSGSLLPAYANVAVGLGTLINGKFVVVKQTVTDGSGRYVIGRSIRPGTGVYIVFTSAHQGTDKGSKSITLTQG